jgi:UDP-N-acetylmuramate--alanine ligase
LFEEFTKAFNQADIVVVTDIYAASEQPIPGVSAEALAHALRVHGHQHVHYVPDKTKIAEYLAPIVESGDAVIAQGAGDINKILRDLNGLLGGTEEALV